LSHSISPEKRYAIVYGYESAWEVVKVVLYLALARIK
jgi:hypothetical protein